MLVLCAVIETPQQQKGKGDMHVHLPLQKHLKSFKVKVTHGSFS